MQEAANDRLLQQAEEHRALAQKQFTEGMARMQAEQEKTISEAARIRDEYAQSARMAQISYESLMNRVENNQSSNVVSLQMSCLKKRSEQYERDLKEINEKHEEELQDKEDMCKRYRRDLERALNKNRALEREKRDLEEHLLTGVLPSSNLSAPRQDSVDSSPEQREHKRPKIDAPSKRDKRRQPEHGPSGISATKAHAVPKPVNGQTTAYTLSAHDAFNLAVVTKDPSSIVDRDLALINQTKALRTSMVATKASITAIVRGATDQAKAGKVKAEKAETNEAKFANQYQAKAKDNGKIRTPLLLSSPKSKRSKRWNYGRDS
jgi:hypothetical protein